MSNQKKFFVEKNTLNRDTNNINFDNINFDNNDLYPQKFKDSAKIYYDPKILEIFKEILKDSKILGASFKNPYLDKTETIPTNLDQLTIRHLHLLTRIEKSNVDGIIKMNQYNNLISQEKVQALRCLVTHTTSACLANYKQYGGYGGTKIEQLDENYVAVIIDSIGFQFQERGNSGDLFVKDSNLHDELYYKIYGETPKKENLQNTGIDNKKFANLNFDLNGYKNGIKYQFDQALKAAIDQGERLDENTKIDFRFLKSGLGFFADQMPKDFIAKLEITRLDAIKEYLELQIKENFDFKKVNVISFTKFEFQGNNAYFKEIFQNIDKKKFTICCGVEDALKPLYEYERQKDTSKVISKKLTHAIIVATTDCGDPHAQIGNEGHYASVDAAIHENAYTIHLNPIFNSQIKMFELQSSNIQINSSQIIGGKANAVNL